VCDVSGVPKSVRSKHGHSIWAVYGAHANGLPQTRATCVSALCAERSGFDLNPHRLCHAGAFRVLSDKYVSDDSGTGVVHQVSGGLLVWLPSY